MPHHHISLIPPRKGESLIWAGRTAHLVSHHPPLAKPREGRAMAMAMARSSPLRLLSCSVAPPSPDSRRRGRRQPDGGPYDQASSSPLRLPERITSASNPFVKHCIKLRISSSYRRSCGAALVVGLTPILEIRRFQQSEDDDYPMVDYMLLLDGTGVPEGFDAFRTPIVRVSPAVMKKVSGMQSIDSTEAVALMKLPRRFLSLEENGETDAHWSPSPHRLLVLDGVQDPGNLGTLLRSAMAFKWDGAFLLPSCCDPFNEKALRAARGASFQLPVVSGTWAHLVALKTKYNMEILAGHPESTNDGSSTTSLCGELAKSLKGKPLCLVLGSEGHGLSEQAMQACELVSIPMAGGFESLNVSVAGGIFLFMLQPGTSR